MEMSKQRHKIETKDKMHRVVLPNGEVGPWTIGKAESWRQFKYMKRIGAKLV
jgi:hypothetical protein